jgi:hypothetical protein
MSERSVLCRTGAELEKLLHAAARRKGFLLPKPTKGPFYPTFDKWLKGVGVAIILVPLIDEPEAGIDRS